MATRLTNTQYSTQKFQHTPPYYGKIPLQEPRVTQPKTTWSISDPATGHRRQAECLASALSAGQYTHHAIMLRKPWSWLAPKHIFLPQLGVPKDFMHALQTAPPQIAVGCGRQAAFVTRILRTYGTYTLQILHPRTDVSFWDIVIAPTHDRITAPTIIPVIGSLNAIDDSWLIQGRTQFPMFADLPRPRIGVLLGGPTHQVPWSPAGLRAFSAELSTYLQRNGGSVMMTSSRRTPQWWYAAVNSQLHDCPQTIWSPEHTTPNPYAGILGWSDIIVATCDSVNLLSEACSTRRPVLGAFMQQARGKMRRFITELQHRQRLCSALPIWPTQQSYEPIREIQRVVRRLRHHPSSPLREDER